MSAEQESELLEWRRRALEGDADAMDRLLAAVTPLVQRRCSAVLPHRADAEEAAQDALLSLARNLGSWAGRGSFLGWVSVIASNSARGTYRSLRRRFNERSSDELPEPVDPRTTSVIAGSRLDLLDALEELQRQHPELVDPVVLRDLSGLSYAEIAEQTAAPLGTVKARIHDGRRFVRERLIARL
ncbi:RNA polymerase sigma-70 factor (ECF subfamily) [Friedmanniella endophytica]|uniref:RNA polymerase sigma-70 factor (ECF subfamily) n=1 Tax=Microlunatus kandeliicorticis TaxID=1759536 RepID=A0A7W3P6E4_9ACTN|nr:RNA polymerase sigma factor [Microlunatus kandeliicorticis]MBA8794893.1 RNA polymerase sigma-70 factor (ECF subfamily) [Microlunatus kandeliicorticis]